MDKKNILTTVVVAALVTIIVSVGFDSMQFSPILGKATPIGSYSSTEFVNANECTKDGVCEMTDAEVNGAIYLGNDSNQIKISHNPSAYEVSVSAGLMRVLGDTNVRDNLQIGEPSGVFPAESSGNLYVENDLVVSGDWPGKGMLLRFTVRYVGVSNRTEVTVSDADTSYVLCEGLLTGETCDIGEYILSIRGASYSPTLKEVEVGILSGNANLVPAPSHAVMSEDSEGDVTYYTDDMRLLLLPK